jgi:hypothetical protein
MLRAGALAAPMYFVEERVVGPSLVKKILTKVYYRPNRLYFGCNLDGRFLPSVWFDCQLCLGV